jgi:tyrosyl-tRNA synthetase
LIRGGGITVNNRKIASEKERLLPQDAIDARYFLVKKGKKDRFLVRIERS